MTTPDRRDTLVAMGRSLFDRGLAAGSSGNISVVHGDRLLITPTNSSLGRLDAGAISEMTAAGVHVTGAKPSKEWPLHSHFYRERTDVGAVVHLHCTYSAAVSCLARPERDIPPLTAYYVMRIGDLGHCDYYPPGDPALFEAVRSLAGKHHAILLANHGPVVAGATLEAAADAIEELEETAKLHLLLRDHRTSPLSADEVDALRSRL